MLRTNPNFKRVFLGFLVSFLLSTGAYAQFRAGVQGTVTDNAGGAIAGATVTLTSKESNQSQTTQTSDEGFYRFTNLAPGLYSVSVEKQDFRKTLIDDVKVDAEAIKGVDPVLTAGVISETVTVQADPLALETEDANIRKTLSTEEVLELPKPGRDPYELARLAPGVFGAGARSASGDSVLLPNTSGPGGSNNSIFQTENAQPISANGQRVSANNYQIDGTSVNSQTWGGAAVITPSQESVKEVQVTSSSYSAEDGRNSGAQIRVVSQNGTNTWHGSGFFKIDDPKLNAFNKFYGVPGVVTATPTRVERRYKTFGGSFGGPIVKDKLFFFFSYEGLKENTSNTYNTLIDTAAFRQGLIAARPGTVSARAVAAAGVEPRVAQILNGGSCQQVGIFVPCQVVAGGYDIGSITGTYGTYVTTDSGGGLDGIADLQFAQLVNPRTFTGNQYFTRIDYQITDKDKFTFSSYVVPTTAFTADTAAQSRPMADINSKRLSFALAFVYLRNISSSMTNEARFNVTRWGFDETSSNPNSDFGIPRIEIEATFNGERIRYGAPRSLNTPGLINEKQFDVRDVLTKVWGNHVLKFGAEYRRDLNSNAEIGGARPFYIFTRPWNFANGTPVLENISADQNGQPSGNNTKFTTSELAFFVQDDWKFRPNLTLNLGLRWSYYSPITASNGVLGNLQLDQDGGLAGAVITTEKTLYDKDLNNFGPQLGFAWSPERFGNKLVLRGGFGMGYDRLPNALLGNARRNPPNGALFDLCCAGAGNPFLNGRISYVDSSSGILGYPRNPLLGGGINPANGLPLSGSVEIWGAPRDLPTAYVYRYSLEGQYQLPMNLVATLGYQGTTGHHFVRILPVSIISPTRNPAIGNAFFASPDVNTNYNAMLARLQGRFMKQLNFDINYRYSKSLDTVSFEGPTGATNQSFPVDQREEHGPSDFDVRHNTSASVLWDLPFFTNKRSWVGRLAGGWQIGAIVSHHTGFPFTPKLFGCLQGTLINGFCDPRPTRFFGGEVLSNTNENFLRPGGIFPNNLIRDASGNVVNCNDPVNVPGGCSRYFLTTFNGNQPFANRPGIGRNVFRGPKYFSLDMSFAKEFGLPHIGILGEDAKLDLRFNFFNILNTLNLTPFNSNTDPTRIQLGSFGTATSALAGRTGEFQIRLSF